MRQKIPLNALTRSELHKSSAHNGNFCLAYLVTITSV